MTILKTHGHIGTRKYAPRWTPDPSRTMLYLPLESDFVDRSGQSTTRVFYTNFSYPIIYTTVGGLQSAHIGSSGGARLTTPYPLQSDITKPLTVSVLIYVTNTNNRVILDMAASSYQRLSFKVRNSGKIQVKPGEYVGYNDNQYTSLEHTLPLNQWVHVGYTVSTTATKLFINGQKVESGNGGRYPRSLWDRSWDNKQGIFCDRSSYDDGLNGNARELIIEQIERSEADMQKYFTRIKQQLGF